MAVLSLPVNFGNSFWSQDYRRGLEVLFDKLDQVCDHEVQSTTGIWNGSVNL